MAKIEQVSYETLPKLEDGRGVAAFNVLLKRAIHDCMDRPGEPKARKITLQIDLTPVVDQDLSCTEVKLQILAKCGIPDYATKVYSTGARKSASGPMLVFNNDSLQNINQGTFTEDEDE